MIGIFSKTTDSNFVEALGYSGMDFVILDQEHGPITNETLHNHVRAAKVSGIKSIVRVKSLDSNAIGSALDAGADGVQVPNISTAEEAKKAVDAARFFPLGERGVCRFVKAAEFGEMNKETYFEKANKKLLILQVEGRLGIENLPEIIKVEGFDILFIGPYDLSQSLGIPGQVGHPKLLAMVQEINKIAKGNNKVIGTFADTLDSVKNYIDSGFEYIAYSVDVNIFLNGALQIKKSIESLKK